MIYRQQIQLIISCECMTGLAGEEVDVEYMLVVVPDLMHTAESLEDYFSPLLNNLPRGKILLVGLPGSKLYIQQ